MPAPSTSPNTILTNAILLLQANRLEEAAALFHQVIAYNPLLWLAHFQLGIAQEKLGNWPAAMDSYLSAANLAPQEMPPRNHLLRAQTICCDFNGAAASLPVFHQLLAADKVGAGPYITVMVEDDPALQKQAAMLRRKELPPTPTLAPYTHNGPLNIGFVSDDLSSHPVGFLMAELFELFDPSRVRCHVYAYGNRQNDAVASRIRKSVHVWHDISSLNDGAAVDLIRSHRIDILVDLKGYTKNARPGIFARRAAPLQMGFLGYPATMGGDGWDYLIADSAIIPPEHAAHYCENILRLPDCFQPNDRKRPLGTPLSRSAYGLPEQGCVFVSFNQPMKYNLPTLGRWMNILKQVPESVLWLRDYAEFPYTKSNILACATAHGVDPARLIFATTTSSQAEHLARYAVADIALDTFPYNSHTTCSDALWMGCPLITKPGNSYASRVAASLLTSVDLPQLITSSWEEYERTAIHLATHAEERQTLRHHLESNRHTFALFDTPQYVRHLEEALHEIHAQQVSHTPVQSAA